MAAKCHFAHGKEEMRSLHDPLPPNTPYITDPKLNKNAGAGGAGNGKGNGANGANMDAGNLPFIWGDSPLDISNLNLEHI